MTDCGLTNLSTCIWTKLGEVVLTALNAPLQPLLNWIKSLLTAQITPNLLLPLWTIIVYIISLFYGLFFLFAGFNFMISGYDAVKRENAKSWIRNVVLMVIFVQGSYLIYSLVIEISALLSTGVIQLIDPKFFLLTVNSANSLVMQLILLIPYVFVLLLTVIFLVVRYVLVYAGIVFFPFAMFFYFIPHLASYGKIILNVCSILIFSNFFACLVLLTCSILIGLPVFTDMKIVVMLVAFLLVDLLFIFLTVIGALKAVFGVLNSDVGRNVTTAVKFLI